MKQGLMLYIISDVEIWSRCSLDKEPPVHIRFRCGVSPYVYIVIDPLSVDYSAGDSNSWFKD